MGCTITIFGNRLKLRYNSINKKFESGYLGTLGHHVEGVNNEHLSAQSILEAWKIIPAINLFINLENEAKIAVLISKKVTSSR